MQKLLISAVFSAALPMSGLLAQPAAQPGSVPALPPEGSAVSGAAQPVPGPDGVIRVFGPSQPVVAAAPAPPQSYPPCTNGRKDACVNPDPKRELPYYPVEKALQDPQAPE